MSSEFEAEILMEKLQSSVYLINYIFHSSCEGFDSSLVADVFKNKDWAEQWLYCLYLLEKIKAILTKIV